MSLILSLFFNPHQLLHFFWIRNQGFTCRHCVLLSRSPSYLLAFIYFSLIILNFPLVLGKNIIGERIWLFFFFFFFRQAKNQLYLKNLNCYCQSFNKCLTKILKSLSLSLTALFVSGYGFSIIWSLMCINNSYVLLSPNSFFFIHCIDR